MVSIPRALCSLRPLTTLISFLQATADCYTSGSLTQSLRRESKREKQEDAEREEEKGRKEEISCLTQVS